MGLDKGKIEAILHNAGLSTKRVKNLANLLAKSDLMEDESVESKSVEKKVIMRKNIAEVLTK